MVSGGMIKMPVITGLQRVNTKAVHLESSIVLAPKCRLWRRLLLIDRCGSEFSLRSSMKVHWDHQENCSEGCRMRPWWGWLGCYAVGKRGVGLLHGTAGEWCLKEQHQAQSHVTLACWTPCAELSRGSRSRSCTELHCRAAGCSVPQSCTDLVVPERPEKGKMTEGRDSLAWMSRRQAKETCTTAVCRGCRLEECTARVLVQSASKQGPESLSLSFREAFCLRPALWLCFVRSWHNLWGGCQPSPASWPPEILLRGREPVISCLQALFNLIHFNQKINQETPVQQDNWTMKRHDNYCLV